MDQALPCCMSPPLVCLAVLVSQSAWIPDGPSSQNVKTSLTMTPHSIMLLRLASMILRVLIILSLSPPPLPLPAVLITNHVPRSSQLSQSQSQSRSRSPCSYIHVHPPSSMIHPASSSVEQL